MHRIAIVALLLCATSVARADGVYVTEAFGGTDVKDQLAQYTSNAFRMRFALGIRTGNWAVEGWLAGDLGLDRPFVDGHLATDLGEYGLDVKRLFPLGKHVDLYLRGSASHAVADYDLDGYSGRGLGVGAGIQFKGKVPVLGFLAWPLFFTNWGPKVMASVFIDNGFDFYRLHENGDFHNGRSVDAQLTHLTVGWGVGSDF